MSVAVDSHLRCLDQIQRNTAIQLVDANRLHIYIYIIYKLYIYTHIYHIYIVHIDNEHIYDHLHYFTCVYMNNIECPSDVCRPLVVCAVPWPGKR